MAKQCVADARHTPNKDWCNCTGEKIPHAIGALK